MRVAFRVDQYFLSIIWPYSHIFYLIDLSLGDGSSVRPGMIGCYHEFCAVSSARWGSWEVKRPRGARYSYLSLDIWQPAQHPATGLSARSGKFGTLLVADYLPAKIFNSLAFEAAAVGDGHRTGMFVGRE